jgi:hypothetical protein
VQPGEQRAQRRREALERDAEGRGDGRATVEQVVERRRALDPLRDDLPAVRDAAQLDRRGTGSPRALSSSSSACSRRARAPSRSAAMRPGAAKRLTARGSPPAARSSRTLRERPTLTGRDGSSSFTRAC